jgi:UPF0755 protein
MDQQTDRPAQTADTTIPVSSPSAIERKRGGVGCFLQVFGALFLLLILAALVLWIGFEWWARRDLRTGKVAPVRVVIQKGDSFRAITRKLKPALKSSPYTLVLLLALRTGTARRIQAGEYDFEPGTPPILVLRTLARGAEAKQARITLPEGWTSAQIADRLAERNVIQDKQKFLDLCGDVEFLRSLGLPAANAEGFLFPDTYEFASPTPEREVIRRMVTRFRKVNDELGLLPGTNSPHAVPMSCAEAVTLASIIEREAKEPDEMPLISSVYHNRLRRDMKLESCATIRFALNQWNAPLTLENLKTDSPYNTYHQKGLPPGPICNPGRHALDAAFRPAQSDYLFYVYRGDGRHAFSRTLAEHEAARKQYKDFWGNSARAQNHE